MPTRKKKPLAIASHDDLLQSFLTAAPSDFSENYLCRCVGAVSGRSPKEWIIDVRLMNAQTLLATSGATISEIAGRTGFDDPSYFTRLFRRRSFVVPGAKAAWLESVAPPPGGLMGSLTLLYSLCSSPLPLSRTRGRENERSELGGGALW